MKKTKLSHKIIAVFLTLNFLTSIIPVNHLFANNNGPNAPEASGFEPVSATDMVNLSSGDMAYVLPLLEIDGFPITLSYHAGIPMDMEASWVGLGWNINTGAIARGVVANPDDWGIGRRLNLTYLNGTIDSYSVNVGVGIAKAAEVGVGLSWGSNKSLSGSVSASVGPISVSIDTNGNYGVGLSAGTASGFGFDGAFDKINHGAKGATKNFGGSLSISGNVNKGGLAANIGVGGSSNGLSSSMGVSISGEGIGASYSIGKGNNVAGNKASSSGAGASMNSFSAGDYSYNTKGFYIPLQIGIFSFGFGYQKTEITLAKGFNKYGYGILYHNKSSLYNTNLGQDVLPYNRSNDDYQRRNTYGDVYEQALPQPEEEFIGDYRNQIEKLNFTFGGYDSYDVNASGIGGALKPIVGQNSVLIGEGYDGKSIRSYRGKTKVFYHNSRLNSSLKQTKTVSNSNTSVNKLNFSFDGQITENAIVTNASINNYSGSVLDISNFINQGNSISSRPKSGSYVETYTNTQIDAGADIMIPSSLKTSSGSITRLSAGYIMDGIGGYKITTPDGKMYHFSQPVYHYEQVQHNFLNFDANNTSKYNSSSKREATPYATHWLLTAITGPDFVDVNNNKFADEDDYGYWVRLDYGQWTNAFAWRSPYDTKEYTNDDNSGLTIPKQSRKHYSTFVDNEIEKSDPGYFVQGRKDLYYLDKIVSKNQTAVFVKDIRYDALGTSADYIFSPSTTSFNDPIETSNIYAKENAKYDKEYQLKLDKIIILNKKESNINIDKTAGSGIAGIYPKKLSGRYQLGGFFDSILPLNNKSHKLHLSENIIDVNDIQSFDYSTASKVIKFNHSYDLAKKTPSSGYINNTSGNYPPYPNNSIVNKEYGRLTLESIKTYGRGTVANANENQLYDYMPPYVFNYNNRDAIHEENQIVQVPGTELNLPAPFNNIAQYKLDRAKKDNWGFRAADVDAWSLNEIKTPLGATINIEYEEDDFYVEAFARRFWENNLSFKTSVVNGKIRIEVTNFFKINSSFWIDFRDYFNLNEDVFIDLWICHTYKQCWMCNEAPNKKIDISPNNSNYDVKVISVSKNTLLLESNYQNSSSAHYHSGTTYSKHHGTNFYFDYARGVCPDWTNGGHNRHTVKYKLLANKIAPGTSGGGLRVKEITVNDNSGSKFITRYDYINPETNETSGITSFDPIRGEVFVPYQNELPGPGVMYEWVTMKAIEIDQNNKEKEIASTRYHYYTLQPVFNIFNPNIDMKDVDGESIFKTEVREVSMNYTDLTAKDIRIEKNLSKIGQLISIEELNEFDHIMSKTTNNYVERDGGVSETFSSMKSVFDFDENSSNKEVNFILNQHYLSLSTKSEKVSVIKSIDNNANGSKSSVEYSDPDEYLGTYTTSLRTMSDGTKIKEEKIPAYKKYAEMGSKGINPTNKNMLTQEAMNISSVYVNGVWKTLKANISTWNDTWTYRDDLGSETTERGIWRKHKNYVWKDDVNTTTGAYNTTITEKSNYFNWGAGVPTNNKWQNISEITRYTHWSSPIETKDINGNYAASKMADNFSKVTASGNARYSEMYYCGAEHVASGNTFEGEVKGANFRTTAYAHTGNYSVKNNRTNDKVFEVFGEVSANHGDVTKDFRPGKYKISFWMYKPNVSHTNQVGATVKFNNVRVPLSETVAAGAWKQYNYYVNLPAKTSFNLHVTNTSTSGCYFDDFRMHPIYATMNSYVYDQDTDELNYILDASNMATKYVYDPAGRLCKTYTEVVNDGRFIGGFKQASKNEYYYKGLPNPDCGDCCDEPSRF